MKRCPTCRRLYADTPFRFCRADGGELVDDPRPAGDAPTILFSETRISERFPWLLGDKRGDIQRFDRQRELEETR